ncbi:MAG: DUF4186 family protein [Sedimentisphaerales bacterium]|nr:DUF4186 family protein [Sedimentisphaerales bacterium]
MRDVEEILCRLKKSKFRGKFKLSDKDIQYINDRGLEVIAEHARDFVTKRLAPAQPKNDGRQTPVKGYPVFIAQHATAMCIGAVEAALKNGIKYPKAKR